MRKHLKIDKSDSESAKRNYRAGCMAGMLHVLDYHHWQNKYRRRKQALCWRNPRTISMEHDTGEMLPFLDSNTGAFPVEKDSTKLKPRTDKLKIIQENFAGEMKKTKKIDRDFSHEQVKEYIDVLQILNVNKEIVVKILKDSDSGITKRFDFKQNPARLTKAGSFPLPGSSRSNYLRPTTLEHKQKEYYQSFPSRDDMAFTINLHKFDSSEAKNDQEPKFSNHGFNHMVLNVFKEIKKRVKNHLREMKKKKKGIDLNGKEIQQTRRTNSINESLDRYSKLLDQSFRRQVKLHSKSLKPANEDHKSGSHARFFRRISSLSTLESFSSFLNELSRDSFSSEMAMDYGTAMGSDEARIQKNVSEEEDLTSGKHQEILQEISVSVSDFSPETGSSYNIAEIPEALISEGSDLVSRIDDPDSSLDIRNNKERNETQELSKEENQENSEYTTKEDEIHFGYVRNILEVSGLLTKDDLCEKWHSEDQPINPSVLHKLQYELDNQQLIFDMVNKAIIEIYEKSCAYFPRRFSFTCRISGTPKGKYLLDEVWGRIRWNIVGSTGNLDRSLDDLVACDLANGVDGWMNLEMEAQWLAMEFEDMIFDELLDECFEFCQLEFAE